MCVLYEVTISRRFSANGDFLAEDLLFLCQMFGCNAETVYLCTRSFKRFCGNSSVGRAQPCQGWGREFESRFPLIERGLIFIGPLFCFLKVDVCNAEVDVCSTGTEDGLT